MQAEFFYTNESSDAIPLLFINQATWDAGLLELTAVEKNLLFMQRFKGALGDICAITDELGICQKVLVGTGKDSYAQALAIAATRLPCGSYKTEQGLPEIALLYWGLAQYTYNQFKKKEIEPRVLMIPDNLVRVQQAVNAIFTVRDLINAPANVMLPHNLAETMAEMAEEYHAFFEQWQGRELLAANFPAVHAVGRASADAPRLLKMVWGEKEHPRVTLVGKGVCFDSGGLDIKPANFMRIMKKDMGGAANALGLAQWLMAANLPIYLTVIIPAVENAIGPNAYRPGDILSMRNGLTVEIDNTDAEGRLILADALSFALEGEPEIIIDFSTLTGAARTAVGTEIAAMFCNDDQLAEELVKESNNLGDPIWRLPLHADYEPLLDSPVADLVNSPSTPYAGAILAALFLQRFVKNGIKWVHFDIMAWNVASKPGKPEGGEAMGIITLANYLINKYGMNSVQAK